MKIVKDELTNLMGSNAAEMFTAKPSIILMSGLQGSGKQLLAENWLYILKKKNKKPLLVACDVYRPAAIDQLQVLGEQIDVPVFCDRDENP